MTGGSPGIKDVLIPLVILPDSTLASIGDVRTSTERGKCLCDSVGSEILAFPMANLCIRIATAATTEIDDTFVLPLKLRAQTMLSRIVTAEVG